MDVADIADKGIDLALKDSLSYKKHVERKKGYCVYCGEPVEGATAYCNGPYDDCRELYEKEQRIRRTY